MAKKILILSKRGIKIKTVIGNTNVNKPINIFGWLCFNLFIPCLPFLLAALIRYISCREFSICLFDQGDFLFSVSLFFILYLIDASKIDIKNSNVERSDIDNIKTFIICCLLMFTVLFAIDVFLKMSSNTNLNLYIADLNNIILKPDDRNNTMAQFHKKYYENDLESINILKYVTFLLFPATLYEVVHMKKKYKIRGESD